MHKRAARFGYVGLLSFCHFKHFFGPIFSENELLKHQGKLSLKLLLADELLGAFADLRLLSAPVVGMPLLDFCGDCHAAFAASQEACKCLWLSFLGDTMRSAGQHGLDFLEERLGYDRLVFALIKLAGIAEVAVIERISQEAPYPVRMQSEPTAILFGFEHPSRKDSALLKEVLHEVQRLVPL